MMELDAYDRWCVKSNLDTINRGDKSAKELLAELRDNGYMRVAAAVEAELAKGKSVIYVIHATIVHHTTDKHGVSCDLTKQIPTFYLSSNVQGITSAEHAAKIAKDIICPVDLLHESVSVDVSAEPMSPPGLHVPIFIEGD